MEDIDKEMSDDHNDDQELDLEYYPIPEGLKTAWEEILKEEESK